jgi:hypothetical protein
LPPETLRNAHVDVVLREAEMCRAAMLASDAHARLGVQQARAACGHAETLRLGRAAGRLPLRARPRMFLSQARAPAITCRTPTMARSGMPQIRRLQ